LLRFGSRVGETNGRCLLWKRARYSHLQFWIQDWQGVQFARGCAYQIYVKERMRTCAGNSEAAALLQRSHYAEPSKKEHQNGAFGEHLVAETEVVRSDHGHSPTFPFGNVVINRSMFLSTV
jgi:hypothetical protein